MFFQKFLLKVAFLVSFLNVLSYGADDFDFENFLSGSPIYSAPHTECTPEICVYTMCPYANTKPQFSSNTKQRSPSKISLEAALRDIASLEELYNFAPDLLSEKPHVLNPAQIKIRYFNFYSIKPDERLHAYESEIKTRFFQILKNAAESSYQFPQAALILMQPKTFNLAPIFQDIAIRDIFQDSTRGISALKTALLTLKEKGKITKKEKESLQLYINFSAFFFDKSALDNLIENCTLPFDSFDSSPEHRMQFIRAIQIQGEFLKNMHPWTFSLSVYPLPPLSTIEKIRDWLSHISLSKLDKLLYNNVDEINELFKLLLIDQQMFYTRIESINKAHPLTGKSYGKPQSRVKQKHEKEEYENIWQSIKDFKENTVVDTHDWPGINKLYEFLKPSAAYATLTTIDPPIIIWQAIIDEFKTLYPNNVDEIRGYTENQEFKKIRQVLQGALQKGLGLEQFVKQLELSSPTLSSSIDDYKKYYDEVSETSTQMKQAFQNGLKEDGERLRSKLYEHQNIFILILLGKTEEQARQIEDAGKLIDQIDRFINAISVESIKPYSGRNSVSEKYAEFKALLVPLLEKLDGSILSALNLTSFSKYYSWSEEPDTLEKWFHLSCKIPIQTKKHKDEYRSNALIKFIKLINQLRDMAGIKTTLGLERSKNWLEEAVNGQISIIQSYLRENSLMQSHSNEYVKNIWNIIDEIIDGKRRPDFISEDMVDSFYSKTQGCFMEIIGFLKLVPTEIFLADKLEDLDQEGVSCEEEKDQIIEDLGNELKIGNSYSHTKKFLMISHKNNVISSKPRRIDDYLVQGIKNQLKDKRLIYEFFIGNFYEHLKGVKDYPELACFMGSDIIRNYFNHPTPFQKYLYSIKGEKSPTNEGTIYLSEEGTLAKEVMVLGINIKFILESLKEQLKAS